MKNDLDLVEVLKSESFIFESEFMAKASTLGVSFLFGTLQDLKSHQLSIFEENEALFKHCEAKILVRCCVTATLAALMF